MAGENLYVHRKKKVEKEGLNRDEQLESMRKQTLEQFFRVSEKALHLQQIHAKDEDRPLSPIHEAFLEKIQQRLEREVERPRTEMLSALYRRGLKKLLSDINDPKGTADWRVSVDQFFKKMIGWDLTLGEKRLRDSLNIDGMREELRAVRAIGDVEKIAAKEKELALRIQGGVSTLTYETELSNPADIATQQKLNCVGYTTVGAALQREVGLQFLAVDQPEHLSSFLVTSDGRVYIEEMQGNPELVELHDSDIRGYPPDGRNVTIADLVQLSRKQTDKTQIPFEVISPEAQRRYAFVYEVPRPRSYIMHAYHPDVGIQIGILNNVQNKLYHDALGYEMVGEDNRQKYFDEILHGKRFVRSNNNLYAAANEAQRYMHGFIGEKRAPRHDRWSHTRTFRKFEGSVYERDFIEQATKENRKETLHCLMTAHDLRHKGYIEEALEKYHEFLSLLDSKKDERMIKHVQKYITELKKRTDSDIIL